MYMYGEFDLFLCFFCYLFIVVVLLYCCCCSIGSEADSIKGKPLRLPVSISRTKLPPTPSSHKQHPSQHHLGNTVDNGNMVTNGKYPWTPVDGYSNENDRGFSIAPGLHDQAVPDFERKKKKKKHRQQFHKGEYMFHRMCSTCTCCKCYMYVHVQLYML